MRRQDREVREIKSIREIIESCKTCHVAMTDGNMPCTYFTDAAADRGGYCFHR